MFTSAFVLTSLAAIVAARPLDNGKPNTFVTNFCPFEVSLWSTGNSDRGPWHIDANGGWYSETFADHQSTIIVEQGRSEDPNGDYAETGKISLGYNPVGSTIWYDVDTLSGGFPGINILVTDSGNNCPAINFPNGVNPDGTDHTKSCTPSGDVTLTLCA
jgi:hypothetical protein